MFKVIFAVITVICFSGGANAHSGGQDANGCHNDKKAGNYHCHKGPLSGQSFGSKAEGMKALDKAKPAGQEMPKPK